MTIFEMLEKLETGIVSLQARYQDLATALEHVQANGNGNGSAPATKKKRVAAVPAKKKRSKARAKKKPARRSASPQQGEEFAQLELPVHEAGAQSAENAAARALGKRQALGKSLLQLRKMSAWRTNRQNEE